MWVSLWGEWGRVRAGEARCCVAEAPRQPGVIRPWAAANEITLPLHTNLTDEQVQYVIDNYVEILKEYL